MNILITGGTGFLGQALIRQLLARGDSVTVLSRHAETVVKRCGVAVKAVERLNELNAEEDFAVVINLAGAPIIDSFWTSPRKQLIRESRITLTEQLVDFMAQCSIKPRLLISGSAIGYYGDQGDSVLNEQSSMGAGFAAQLCHDWEQAARRAEPLGIRVCLLRTGLVIGGEGGFLQRLLLPFRMGLGGCLGNGRQWMSWISQDDWVAIVLAMIDQAQMHGVYNATAPNPVTNCEFTETLARRLNRPAWLPIPAVFLKYGLGERSELLLSSQRVLPERLLAQDFSFQHTQLNTVITLSLAG